MSDHTARNLVRHVGAGAHLATEFEGHDVRWERAAVGRAESHERMHVSVSVKALHEVATDEAAERMADHVHAFVPRLIAYPLDETAESRGDRSDVVGQG
jgi:hypothetical protein